MMGKNLQEIGAGRAGLERFPLVDDGPELLVEVTVIISPRWAGKKENSQKKEAISWTKVTDLTRLVHARIKLAYPRN